MRLDELESSSYVQMNVERYQHVKQIFLDACELEPGQVAAFLDRSCAGDAELRNEVESLLRHHLSETIIQPLARRSASPSDFRPEPFWPGDTELSVRWVEAGWATCTAPTT